VKLTAPNEIAPLGQLSAMRQDKLQGPRRLAIADLVSFISLLDGACEDGGTSDQMTQPVQHQTGVGVGLVDMSVQPVPTRSKPKQQVLLR
jgi:hypothetical protein